MPSRVGHLRHAGRRGRRRRRGVRRERHVAGCFPASDGWRDRADARRSCRSAPCGSSSRRWQRARPAGAVSFACSPENLRLGKAIEVFTQSRSRRRRRARSSGRGAGCTSCFAPITDRIEWMSVESAEMTKHAINAFLATSVTFINELAALCERVGADAKEVERGLKTERRIGPHAYLSPGGAFAGGTLARDVSFLRELGTRVRLDDAADGRRAGEQPSASSVGAAPPGSRNWARLRDRALRSGASPTSPAPIPCADRRPSSCADGWLQQGADRSRARSGGRSPAR